MVIYVSILMVISRYKGGNVKFLDDGERAKRICMILRIGPLNEEPPVLIMVNIENKVKLFFSLAYYYSSIWIFKFFH